MIEDTIDHEAVAKSRVTTQYWESTKFLATIAAFAAKCQNIEDALIQVSQISDIDTQEGVNLDVIGDIVGIGRSIHAMPLPFFGFDDTSEGLTFGDTDIPGRGGMFYELGEDRYTDWSLDDTDYRTFIRARISRNHSSGTGEDIIRTLKIIFPSDNVVVNDVAGHLAINIGLTRAITAEEAAIMAYTKILPKPVGVAINVVPYTVFIKRFGFEPLGAAFGDLDFPTRGGPFIEEQY